MSDSATPHPFDERVIAKLAIACDLVDEERASGILGANWKRRHDEAYAALAYAVNRAAENARRFAQP